MDENDEIYLLLPDPMKFISFLLFDGNYSKWKRIQAYNRNTEEHTPSLST